MLGKIILDLPPSPGNPRNSEGAMLRLNDGSILFIYSRFCGSDAADDAAELLRDLEGELDFSPDELDRLESRLDVIYRLKKKYGPTVADMLDYLERCRRELEQIQDADDTIQKLEKELEGARA